MYAISVSFQIQVWYGLGSKESLFFRKIYACQILFTGKVLYYYELQGTGIRFEGRGISYHLVVRELWQAYAFISSSSRVRPLSLCCGGFCFCVRISQAKYENDINNQYV